MFGLSSKFKARSQCWPFSEALMAAMYLIRVGSSRERRLSSNEFKARSHCWPFSQALMAV